LSGSGTTVSGDVSVGHVVGTIVGAGVVEAVRFKDQIVVVQLDRQPAAPRRDSSSSSSAPLAGARAFLSVSGIATLGRRVFTPFGPGTVRGRAEAPNGPPAANATAARGEGAVPPRYVVELAWGRVFVQPKDVKLAACSVAPSCRVAHRVLSAADRAGLRRDAQAAAQLAADAAAKADADAKAAHAAADAAAAYEAARALAKAASRRAMEEAAADDGEGGGGADGGEGGSEVGSEGGEGDEANEGYSEDEENEDEDEDDEDEDGDGDAPGHLAAGNHDDENDDDENDDDENDDDEKEADACEDEEEEEDEDEADEDGDGDEEVETSEGFVRDSAAEDDLGDPGSIKFAMVPNLEGFNANDEDDESDDDNEEDSNDESNDNSGDNLRYSTVGAAGGADGAGGSDEDSDDDGVANLRYSMAPSNMEDVAEEDENNSN
jgi:hypothetical protein